MGFRWTIVQAGPDGLRLELRGLLLKRGWFLPRQRIGRLHKRVSLLIPGQVRSTICVCMATAINARGRIAR